MGKRWLDDVFGLPRGTILIAFVLIVGSLWLFGYIRALNYSFDGVIENVSYDYPKHIPTITISGIDYNLNYLNWSNNTEDIQLETVL